MVQWPQMTMLEHVIALFSGSMHCPYSEDDPLAHCYSREEFRATLGHNGLVELSSPYMLHDRFPLLPGAVHSGFSIASELHLLLYTSIKAALGVVAASQVLLHSCNNALLSSQTLRFDPDFTCALLCYMLC